MEKKVFKWWPAMVRYFGRKFCMFFFPFFFFGKKIVKVKWGKKWKKKSF